MSAVQSAEKAVVSIVLLEPGAIKYCRENGLTADSFSDPRNRAWFQTVLELTQAGQPADSVSCVMKLQSSGTFNAAGGVAYAAELADCPAIAQSLPHYVEKIKSASVWRVLKAIGRELVEKANDPGESTPSDVVAELSHRICATTGQKSLATPYGDIATQEVDRWARIANGEPPAYGLPCGLFGPDDALQGFQPGKLYVLAGRPSDGKTTFEGQTCRHIALTCGRPVLRITRDSAVESLARRDLVAMTPGATIHKANLGQLTPVQLESMKSAAMAIKAAPIYVDERTRSVEDMALQIRFAVARHNVQFVTVDYAQIVEVTSLKGRAADDERQQIRFVSKTFKALAKELRIPILLLAQLSRRAEEDKSREPEMKDLLGSGALEQDADAIIMLFRSIRFNYDLPANVGCYSDDGLPIVDVCEGRKTVRTAGPGVMVEQHGPRRPVVLALKKNKDGPQGRWCVWLDSGFFTFRMAPENHGQ